MGRGPSGSPAGERDRARIPLPGLPEAAAAGAAIVLYSPLGADGRLASVLLASGALACAAALALRRALCAPGLSPSSGDPEFHRRRARQALTLQACLIAAGLGLGAAWGGAVSASRLAASASWLGIPADGVESVYGRLVSDSRTASSGATRYELEACHVRSAFQGADAKGRLTLIVEGGPPMSARELMRARCPMPEGGKPAFLGPERIESLGFGNALDSARAAARRAFISAVSRIESPGGPLLVALMTGDKSGLSPEEESAFRKAGCSHILALSGQHIAILAGLLGFLLVPLAGKRAALALSSLIVVAYLLVTGVQPSMLRAVLSFLLAAAAWYLSRKPRSATILAWTFLIATAAQPESPGSASFCLSYGSTAGIILFRERLGHFLAKWLPPAIANALAVSLGACAASAPVSIALFGSFNPACVLTSTASGPLVSLMMWIGCAGTLACALLPGAAAGKAAGALLGFPYRLLRAAVDAGASCPGLSFAPGSARAAACAVLACLILLLYAWRLYGPPRIRFPQGPQGLPRKARLRHAEKIRPKLPSLPQRAGEDRLPAGRRGGG